MAALQPAQAASALNPNQLSQIWSQLDTQVHAFTVVVGLPGIVYRQLDDGAKAFVAAKLMEVVREDVVYCRDGTEVDRYFLGPLRHFVAGTGRLVQHMGSDVPIWVKLPGGTNNPSADTAAEGTRIPRPPNAYILYRTDRHKILKEAHPELSNKEISSVLGKAWQNENEAVRTQYRLFADEVKADLLRRYPDYRYRPRRPTQRRRRNVRTAPPSTNTN